MRRLLLIGALGTTLGCGRLGFAPGGQALGDAAGDVLGDVLGDVVTGHDEDGDGVPDVIDNCPHIAAAQTDTDGDGVGDACDPAPTVAGERIALFATMAPTDQPLVLGGNGTWSQKPDSIRFEGNYGTLRYDLPIGAARITFGIDVGELVLGMGQNQIALGTITTATRSYFVQVQQFPGVERVAVTLNENQVFMDLAEQPLQSGIPLGSLMLQHTMLAGAPPVLHLDAIWPGEPYQLFADAPLYTGATAFQLAINNIVVEVRYVVVIVTD